ncbi:MAG: sugar-binding transcriptional regulator [Candidatus Poribacteria bacterium]
MNELLYSLKEITKLRNIIQCAQLYYGLVEGYEGGMTQNEVAKKLNLTRNQVVTLLQEMRDRGLLEIKLRVPRALELEQHVIARYEKDFGLRDVRIVIDTSFPNKHYKAKSLSTEEFNEASTIQAVGEEAARYIRNVAPNGEVIGVGGGRTVLAMASALSDGMFEWLRIFPLSAGGPIQITANSVVAAIAAKCANQDKTEAYGLYVPPLTLRSIDESTKEKEFYLSRKEIREVYEAAHNVNAAFLGIGSLKTEAGRRRTAEYLFADDALIADAIEQGAVGNILQQFFDADGDIVKCQLSHRNLAVPLEHLRKIAAEFPAKRVIALASGKYKCEAIKAAIKGRFFNVLITDTTIAEFLLSNRS